jgi:ATP-dependent DNA helicase RecG
LLNGDVGSGKTVVAAIAALNVARNNGQTVLLSPTEILAAQHFNTLSRMLAPFGVKVALLTASHHKFFGRADNFKKLDIKKLIKTGKVDLIIGTHALLEEDVKFKNLALVVVDEQHRFGVHQRQLLRSKTTMMVPHFLSMTATPIPRTLALTIYGDLDLSILDEMPPGRKVIQTKFIADREKQPIYEFIKSEMRKGRQVFCICPLIDPSDVLEVKSVKEMKEQLESKIFPEFRISLLHGKMRSADKERVMREFLNKKFDILVSTSVVEVGVDVPNATVMMIEGAERFGLAQLHQFRGRIGRGENQSYCFLFSDAPSDKAKARLRVIEKNYDGFALAERDLEFRGAGELLGTRQWGREENRFLDFSDLELIKICREAAGELILEDSTFGRWPELKNRVREFVQKVHPE